MPHFWPFPSPFIFGVCNVGTIYTFSTQNFTIRMSYDYDQDWDATFDETGETAEKINSGEWGAYVFHAEVIHRKTGAVIGEDYLGNSIYENPQDFRDHVGARGRWGSYFRDMIGRACEEARDSLKSLQAVQVR